MQSYELITSLSLRELGATAVLGSSHTHLGVPTLAHHKQRAQESWVRSLSKGITTACLPLDTSTCRRPAPDSSFLPEKWGGWGSKEQPPPQVTLRIKEVSWTRAA